MDSAAAGLPASDAEGVAIVGLSCQFPGARDRHEFWRNLRAGRESITFFDEATLLAAGCPPQEVAAPNYVKAGGILEEVDRFDAGFFGFTPREASLMDPQFRLLLEHSWMALEDAGHDPHRASERVAVYAGMSMSSYLFHVLSHGASDPTRDVLGTMIANDKDALATRVAYALNLRGPCLTVQTFCSTSLVCTHLAAQSILSGESDLALAAGVSIKVPHISGYRRMKEGITSSDGHTRAFDDKSDGTIFTNGIGVVVLKALGLARRDRNHIYAVIRGSAANNDGANKVGYTAPGVHGQAEVIREAMSNAGVTADDVAYVETHGTGTRLGDATELNALQKAFKDRTAGALTCGLGSVKTNIGHTDVASGVAGLIKAALSVAHGELPPSLHCLTPNAELDRGLFHVHRELQTWTSSTPLCVGVSSFGIGGTNAHVVLEEPPPSAPSLSAANETPWRLLVLSARSEPALDRMAANLRAHLEAGTSRLTDVAHTLRAGRTEFNHRRTLLCRDAADALRQLAVTPGNRVLQTYDRPPVVFHFGPTGHRWWEASTRLFQQDEAFRHAVEQAPQLDRLLGFSLRHHLATAERPACPSLERWLGVLGPFFFARALLDAGVAPLEFAGGGGKAAALALSDVLPLEVALRGVTEGFAAPAAKAPRIRIAGVELSPELRPGSPLRFEVVERYLRAETPFDPPEDAGAVIVTFGSLPANAAVVRGRVLTIDDGILSEAGSSAVLSTVGDIWRLGVRLDWAKLNAIEQGRLVPLPTYPFERQRHWVDPQPTPPPLDLPARRPFAEWFYLPSWRREPASAAAAVRGSRVPCVVFDPHGPAAQHLLREFIARAEVPVIVVGNAAHPETGAAASLRVDLRDDAAVGRFLATLERTHGRLENMIYLGAYRDSPETETAGLDAAFFNVAAIAKALAGSGHRHPRRLLNVTRNLHAVIGTETANPAWGALVGLGRALRTEMPWLRAGNIDFSPANDAAVGAAADALHRELAAPSAPSVVAYRHGHRWTPCFEPATDLPPTPASGWRNGGVYVIIGGLGGLGFALAKRLLVRHAAKVFILGRTPQERLANSATPGRQRDRWLELAAAGDVTYLSADVADRAALTAAFERIFQRCEKIDGVIHAAGVAGGGLLQVRARADADAVLAPKVQGLRHLQAVLRDRPVDRLVLFSSITALLGDPGQADYAAANAHLDAAADAAGNAGRTVAINWDAWTECGMARETAVPSAFANQRQARLQRGLGTEEGLDALEMALALGQSRVIVATSDFRRELSAPLAAPELTATTPRAGNLQPRPQLSTPFAAATSPTEKRVAELWQPLFGIQGLGVDDDFFELGGHSLLAVQLLDRLRPSMPGAELALSDVLSNPTIRQFAAVLDRTPPSNAVADAPVTDQPRAAGFAGEVEQLVEELFAARGLTPAPAAPLDLAPIAADFAWQMKARHQFPVYEHELKVYETPRRAMDYFAAEHRLVTRPREVVSSEPIRYRPFPTPPRVSSRVGPKLPRIALLHSTPRAGSTIARLMLAANARLFVPPELGLFNFSTMGDWHGQADRGMIEGVVNTFAVARNISRDAAATHVQQLVATGAASSTAYREILESLPAGTLMVEKTPGYGMHWPMLETLEDAIAEPIHLHLVRHPRAVIDSYVRNRFFRRVPNGETDPFALAERMWIATNRNLERLGELVGPRRYLRIRYEDLVTDSTATLTQVCEQLGVAFDPAMLNAYASDRVIPGPGDPSLYTHQRVERELADSWKTACLPRTLCPECTALAHAYGYAETEPLTDSTEDTTNRELAALLGNFDQLSSEEIEAALRGLDVAEKTLA